MARERKSGLLKRQVLRVLWTADGPLTPGQVHEALGDGLAYTTVLTVVTRMFDEGLLERHRTGRSYSYAPLTTEADLTASRMQADLSEATDRSAALARFVAALDPSDEAVLRDALGRPGRDA